MNFNDFMEIYWKLMGMPAFWLLILCLLMLPLALRYRGIMDYLLHGFLAIANFGALLLWIPFANSLDGLFFCGLSALLFILNAYFFINDVSDKIKTGDKN